MIFSVIIPVYKVEKYLNQCVDSVLNQDFKDYEIILVDDGSPDNCPKLCDEYAKKYSHIKVIHKENGGLSDARNLGIKAAQGEYLIFLDSDDYWKEIPILSCLSDIIRKDCNPDIVIYGSNWIDENDRIKSIKHTERTGKLENDLAYLIKEGIFDTIAWNKCIKKSLIDNHQIRFPFGKYHEDCAWCFDIAHLAETYSVCPVSFYQYRVQRAGAITSNIDDKHIDDLFYILENKLAIWENLSRVQKDQLGYYLFNLYISILYKNEKLNSSKDYKKRSDKLHQFEIVLIPYVKVGRYVRIKQLMYRVFGVKNSIKLIQYIKGVMYEK